MYDDDNNNDDDDFDNDDEEEDKNDERNKWTSVIMSTFIMIMTSMLFLTYSSQPEDFYKTNMEKRSTDR